MKPITIEQSASEAKLAFEIHKNAQIDSVRLANANLHAIHPSEFGGEAVKLNFGFRAERRSAPRRILRILVSFVVSATPGEAPKESPTGKTKSKARISTTSDEPTLLVEAGFEVDYSLRDQYEPEEDAIDAFQNGNAIFNVWPYFREFLQSVTTRMGHPPLTAPFLKLRPKPEEKRPPGNVDQQSSPEPTSRPTSRRKKVRPQS